MDRSGSVPRHLPLRHARPSMERGAIGAMYKLVIRGELDERYAYLFNGLKMQRIGGTTVLTGTVVDQAQLHGFIARVEELGLELVSVGQLNEPA